MITVRSLLFNIYFFGWTIFVLLVFWLLLPLPRRYMQRAVRLWGLGVQHGLKWIVGTGCEVRGRENLPPGPVILASKHQSAWDTAFFHVLCDDPSYILKKELTFVPFWGAYAQKCGAIVVDRTAGASALKKMVRLTAKALAAGQQMIIFPEGTRTPPGERHPYFPGIAALYSNTKAPVVPVALNSGVFWGRRSFIKRPGTIVVQILPPLPAGLDRRTFMAQLEERIETATAALIEEARSIEEARA